MRREFANIMVNVKLIYNEVKYKCVRTYFAKTTCTVLEIIQKVELVAYPYLTSSYGNSNLQCIVVLKFLTSVTHCIAIHAVYGPALMYLIIFLTLTLLACTNPCAAGESANRSWEAPPVLLVRASTGPGRRPLCCW